MREYLFRGKREDNGKWEYGAFVNARDIIDDQQKSYIIWEAEYFSHGEFACVEEVIPETVGRYTGLCDKNSTKIFEGDILLKGFEKVLVKWNSNQCRWGIYSNGYEISGFNESTKNYFEVIGNIYDNPELLGVKQ